MTRKRTPLPARLWAKVDTTGGPDACWPFTRTTDGDGYGRISHLDGNQRTHRVAWQLAYGTPIPDGMWVLHSCNQPGCCNPDHLRLGTAKDNAADRVAAGHQRNGYTKKGGTE